MKFVTYASTTGLERLPESQRFRVYRSAYKQLMRTDTQFRRRVRRFRLAILGMTALFLVLSQFWRFISLPGILEPGLNVFLPVMYCLYVVRASFSEQQFENKRVGAALQKDMA
jgi:hypothetical protein